MSTDQDATIHHLVPDHADGDPVQYLLDGLGDPDRGVSRPLTASAVTQIVMGYVGQEHPGEIARNAQLAGVSFLDVLVDAEHGPFLLVSTMTVDHKTCCRQATAIVMLRAWDTSTVPGARSSSPSPRTSSASGPSPSRRSRLTGRRSKAADGPSRTDGAHDRR